MRTRTLLWASLLLGLIAGGFACSDDSGGGDVCEQAFNKTKACTEKLDCTNVAGANKAACDFNKQFYGALVDYATAIHVCKQTGSTTCECTGETKADAEKVMSAELDPETCMVQDVQPDGGVDQQVVDQQTPSE